MPRWHPPWTFPYISTAIAFASLAYAAWAALGLRSCLDLECAGNTLGLMLGATVGLGFSIPFWSWVRDRIRERTKRP